ncbi:MAG: site-specific DNA-methyltransferase [Gemmatimonadaceae bacterium]|nr:site-specific DNA-methyltransferase [Gemmatimonadaceae bacterium]
MDEDGSTVVPPQVALPIAAAESAALAIARASITATPRAPRQSSRTSGATDTADTPVVSYRHGDRRRNNPEVGMVDPETDPTQPKTRWAYDPHLDPALQFDVGRAAVERLIDDALASGDEKVMRGALEQLKRQAEPYLAWTGKSERTSFDVDTVSLHVHERIDPASILAAVRKGMKYSAGKIKPPPAHFQLGLYSAPFENLPLRDAIDFYKHDKGWSNRLISGDSLLVMNSLLQKEGMAGQVQMFYVDPPYGIKYGSNFQPFVNKRDVKDRKDEDLTQEPEMIKAFRDTWELGVHSYLTFLRDRVLLAHPLLHESGSIFVQISGEHIHRVRSVLDEVFGPDNHVETIAYRTKNMTLGGQLLEGVFSYVVWYAKNKEKVKFRRLYLQSFAEGDNHWGYYIGVDGNVRKMNSEQVHDHSKLPEGADPVQPMFLSPAGSFDTGLYSFEFRGTSYDPPPGRSWKSPISGMRRLSMASRLIPYADGGTLRYALRFSDYPVSPLHNIWADTAPPAEKIYAVQTGEKVIDRCILMTTDPGDLVFDPTCGSGTTAVMAEKRGRRWVTCDTSRVAITLAKQRLMTTSFDYYELKYPHEGLKAGFIYETVPHVTLKAIANNPEVDEIWNEMHPAQESALGDLNLALGKQAPSEPFVVSEGVRRGTALDFRKKGTLLKEWEVPLEWPEAWPTQARTPFDILHAERQAMQRKIDESIKNHSEREILYDRPKVAKDKLRITGPFSVEAVPFPTVFAIDETQPPVEADVAIARSGESSRQHQWRDELLRTGIRGKGGQMLKLTSLETLPDTRYIHGSGTIADTGDRIVVSFGPEHGALEQRQVEMGMREAGELFPRPKMIVFCAFVFDPEAAKDIDQTKGITALKAQMNTDLLTEDLKKARASNQSFWLMGQPEIELRTRKDGLYEVEVCGFDYFDTTKGELVSGGKGKIAMWSLDTDYDERSLFPRQVFFPMAGAKDGWHRLRKDLRAELDESRLECFHGTVSLPFAAGDNRKIAVKVVDDRGIESLKILRLD